MEVVQLFPSSLMTAQLEMDGPVGDGEVLAELFEARGAVVTIVRL